MYLFHTIISSFPTHALTWLVQRVTWDFDDCNCDMAYIIFVLHAIRINKLFFVYKNISLSIIHNGHFHKYVAS